MNGIWEACTATECTDHDPAYEDPEANCDNLDNDCDGQTDIDPEDDLPLQGEC